ncbi:MAG TPA: LLM class flavin-dependent oxidoreductase [Polyangiaceae bacterium]|jgi:luciferase family oxidoreductase group 1
MPLPLSVLDLSPIPSGTTAQGALENTLDLARHAESLGCVRYWLAEHHNAGGLASSAPEIVIGQVARVTKTIRVGAGGIMLPNHTPLKVAELFRVLSAFFPGRIDLGIGRAPGTDPRTARALRRGTAEIDFDSQLDELTAYLEKETPPRHPFAGTTIAIPIGVAPPPIYMLGSSDGGVGYAAKRGLPFAFAHHINPVDAVAMMNRYRDEFVPNAAHPKPHAILAVGVVTAESEEAVRSLERCVDLGMVRFAQGLRDLPMPSEAEARDYVFDADEDALRLAMRGRFFVGAIDRVSTELHALAHDARADELMVLANVHDHEKRKNVYTLLRDALG